LNDEKVHSDNPMAQSNRIWNGTRGRDSDGRVMHCWALYMVFFFKDGQRDGVVGRHDMTKKRTNPS